MLAHSLLEELRLRSQSAWSLDDPIQCSQTSGGPSAYDVVKIPRLGLFAVNLGIESARRESRRGNRQLIIVSSGCRWHVNQD
jgi:hypothetical protein